MTTSLTANEAISIFQAAYNAAKSQTLATLGTTWQLGDAGAAEAIRLSWIAAGILAVVQAA